MRVTATAARERAAIAKGHIAPELIRIHGLALFDALPDFGADTNFSAWRVKETNLEKAIDCFPVDAPRNDAGERGSDEFSARGQIVVSGYYPIRGEIDPLPLLYALHDRGVELALPVIKPGPALIFRKWTPTDILVRRKYGLFEPGDENPRISPNILLVPLLAFARRGYRLGYGGGYYDAGLRTLRKEGPVLAIGVAYDEQEISEIPHEPQDELLDLVLTPSGLVRCGD